jgi:hypothetical protein
VANRVKIQRKYHPPQADQTRAARTQRGIRRQFLAKVVTQITAATFNTSTDTLTLGSGTVTPLAKDADAPTLSSVDESQTDKTVYNVTNSPSASPSTKYVVVWVIQSDIDGELYYFEPCESFDL